MGCYGKMPCVTMPSGESAELSQGENNLDSTTHSTKLRVPLCSSTVGVHGVWLPDISMSDTFLPSLYISSLHFHTFLKTRVCCLKGLNLLSDGTRPTVWCHRLDQHPYRVYSRRLSSLCYSRTHIFQRRRFNSWNREDFACACRDVEPPIFRPRWLHMHRLHHHGAATSVLGDVIFTCG